VWKGKTQDFTAVIKGTNEPDQRVEWIVSNNTSKDTRFEGNILHVAADETAEHFTVTATSKFDTSKTGSSNVNLVRPKVTGVTILEKDTAIYKGGSMEFHAIVEGPRGPDQDVQWSITGNSSKNTKFEANKLVVARDEKNKSWTVKATSYFDGENSATTVVKLAYQIATSSNMYGKINPKYHDRLDEYAPEGGTITIDVRPEKYYKLKSLQYENGSRSISIDLNSRTFTMPASDITVSAVFDELAVGDRGPGGGWVFYKNPRANASWKYLECAPTDVSPQIWSSSTVYVKTIDGLGSGKENASRFSSASGTFPAAAEAAWYKSNGLEDWYLPSHKEMEEMRLKLKSNKDFKASVQGTYYWSSSEELSLEKEKRCAYVVVLPELTGEKRDSLGNKKSANTIRPIRQF
jgi:hypothetical protein